MYLSYKILKKPMSNNKIDVENRHVERLLKISHNRYIFQSLFYNITNNSTT